MNRITVFKTKTPCNKIYKADGSYDSCGVGKTATATTRCFETLEQLAEIYREVADDPCACIAPTGYFKHAPNDGDRLTVRTKEWLKAQDWFGGEYYHEGIVARVNDQMEFGGVMFLDYDQTDGMPDRFRNMDEAKLLAFIRETLGDVGVMITKSSSSRVGKESGGLHAMVLCNGDQRVFKAGWLTKGFEIGWSFMKPTKAAAVQWTVFDPSVIGNQSRLDYCGKPTGALEVLPPHISVHDGGVLDCEAWRVKDDSPAVVAYEKAAKSVGATVAKSSTGIFNLRFVGAINLGSEFETEDGMMTVQQFLDSGADKVRCQVPAWIRDSRSWNGILRLTQKGTPVFIDNGTATHYFLGDEEIANLVAPAGNKKPKSKLFNPKDPLAWTRRFVMTQEQVDAISQPKWIYENLIIQGHLIAIPAPPNGGKTTLMMGIAPEIVRKGYRVVYVNADISGTDAKMAYAQAMTGGFELLTPDFVMDDDGCGLSMSDVVELLEDMSGTDADFSSIVFIFDTLKKMTDVIQKSEAKQLYQTLRKLTARGATVICLCHTNKYKDGEGNLVYEGTGDLRADVDELIYLYPNKRSDGSTLVSTQPDKVRGAFRKITFEISKDREVSLRDKFVDVMGQIAWQELEKKDAIEIEAIDEVLSDKKAHSRTDIIAALKENPACRGRDSVRKVLDRYDGRKWVSRRGDKNSQMYVMLSMEYLLGDLTRTQKNTQPEGIPPRRQKTPHTPHTPHKPHTPPTQGTQRFPAGEVTHKSGKVISVCGVGGVRVGTEKMPWE